MIVPLDIPDKLWADFCIHLEHVCQCNCIGDGQDHMLRQIREHMLNVRARKIAIKRSRRIRREGGVGEGGIPNVHELLQYLSGESTEILPSIFSREEQVEIQEVWRDYGLTK